MVRYDNERGKAIIVISTGWKTTTASSAWRSYWQISEMTWRTGNESDRRNQREQRHFRRGSDHIAAGGNEDFHPGFESARQLFAEITPARLDLLDTLRRNGPCSIHALAKAAARNYSNDHTDIARLIELGLVEKTDGEMIYVPFDDVEVHFRLAQAA